MPLYVTNRQYWGPWWSLGPIEEAMAPLRPIYLREYKKRNPFGVVYVIGFDSGLNKIGSSGNPLDRIRSQVRQIETYGNVRATHVAVSIACSNFRQIESALHDHFAADRQCGELFRIPIDNIGAVLVGMDLGDEAIEINTILSDGRKVRVFERLSRFVETDYAIYYWNVVINETMERWGFASREFCRVVTLARANTDGKIDRYWDFASILAQC